MKPCYLSLVENETSFVRSKMKRIIIFMLDSHTNMHRKFSSSYRSEFIVNIELCFFCPCVHLMQASSYLDLIVSTIVKIFAFLSSQIIQKGTVPLRQTKVQMIIARDMICT